MNTPVLLRRVLPLLVAFLMASCGDPTVAYWEKTAEINAEYSKKSDELVQRLLELKKNPTLTGIEKSSKDAVELLRERDEKLAGLNTKNVDPAVTAYVREDRELFAKGRELAERVHQYAEKTLKEGPSFSSNRMSSRQEIRLLLAEAGKLEQQAEILRKEKSAALGKELPPLYFRLPDTKQVLSCR